MMTTGKAKSVAVTVIVIAIALLTNFSDGMEWRPSVCGFVPCHNGRCFRKGSRIPVRRCSAGYTGFRCNNRPNIVAFDDNECKKTPSPCLPDGVCINTVGSYKCTCPKGFEGDGHKCRSLGPCPTCKNGAICEKSPSVKNITCKCAAGFTGQNCEIPCEQEKVDILLIDDVSTSISQETYNKMKDFEIKLLGTFDINAREINVAMMTFARTSKLVFPLKAFSNNKKAAVQVAKASRYTGGPTLLGDAIKLAVSDVFVQSKGDRPDAANIVIIFTDGQSSQGSVIVNHIGSLHAVASVFVVPVTAHVHNATIKQVASPPDQDHVFPLKNPHALDTIMKRTIYESCKL